MKEKQLTVWIPDDVYIKLKIMSAKENKTIKVIVNEMFKLYFKNK